MTNQLHCTTVSNQVGPQGLRDVFFLPPPPHSPEDGALVLVFHFVIALVVLDALGQTEVSDLHRLLIFHQHIPGSQVAVDVIFRSQIFHPLRRTNRRRDKMSHVNVAFTELKESMTK